MRWSRLTPPKEVGGLGFRDLSCFNLAMLTKQGWRLFANNTSLCHRVYKAKYFSNSSFMEAEERQTNSSYVWQSLIRGREVLKLGIRWRLGNGSKAQIWQDPWIPRNINFKLTPHSFHFLPIATTVNFLFVQGRT